MSKASCDNPGHVGYPLVDRRELVDRRTEWRDITTGQRFKVRQIRRECKTCVRRELEPASPQGSLL